MPLSHLAFGLNGAAPHHAMDRIVSAAVDHHDPLPVLMLARQNSPPARHQSDRKSSHGTRLPVPTTAAILRSARTLNPEPVIGSKKSLEPSGIATTNNRAAGGPTTASAKRYTRAPLRRDALAHSGYGVRVARVAGPNRAGNAHLVQDEGAFGLRRSRESDPRSSSFNRPKVIACRNVC